jgi:polyisoprenoid-binding protein YceI
MNYLILICACFACKKPAENISRATFQQSDSIVIETEIKADKVKKPINQKKSTFEFEGYSAVTSHKGTFDNMVVILFLENNEVTGFDGVIDAASVDTGIDGLDNHLRSEDFFNSDKYPEIKFISTDIKLSNDEKILTGFLTFRGIKKEISFPVKTTKNSIEADFILDTSTYKMQHKGANREVKISFKFKL